ncbi:MAG: LapA family protein [Ignavibacteriaceae bacterium]|jgi:putative membrane protein
MNVKTISILALLGLFIIICIQNVEVIPIHFLFWEMEISKLLMLIITLVAGILIGMLVPGYLKKSPKEEKIDIK